MSLRLNPQRNWEMILLSVLGFDWKNEKWVKDNLIKK